MTYSYVTNYGGGVVLAPAGAVFLGEVALCANLGLLPGITNLGELGNAIHLAEGWTNSDHNAFVKNPQGLSYVRAFDFGGPVSTWAKLIEFWNHRYALKDPRVYWPGYTNSDQAPPHGLTIWYSAGLTRQGTDGPHAHLSLARANTTTSGLAAWTPALDSLAPWGLQDFLTGHSTDSGTATPITEEDDMTPAQADQLAYVYARLAATTPDAEYFTVDADGKASHAGRTTPGAKPVALLDTLDGNTIVLTLRQISARLAALEAKSGTPAS